MKMRNLIGAGRIVWQGEGAGTGAGGGADEAAAAAAAAAAAGAGAGAGGKWWEASDYTPEDQQWLTARGLTEDDPAKIIPKLVKGHRSAESKLGRGVDSIMDRPAKDQALPDWMRANKEVFGLPEAADGYTITRPEGLGEGIAWDSELETAAKARAHELGLTPAQLDGMTALYAGKIGAIQAAADQAATAANDRMMVDLTRDYGAALPEKLALARQAATVLGQKAGLDAAGIAAVSGVLTEKAGGDAATIRMFAALGEMMGDDRMVAGQAAGPETRAAAQQKLAQLQAPDGDYYKAVEKARNDDPAEMQRLKPEIDRLTRVAAGK